MAFSVEKVSVLSRVVDAVELPLPHVQVGFAERPGLRQGQAIQMIADLDQSVVQIFKSVVDFAFPVRGFVSTVPIGPRPRRSLFFYHIAEFQAPLQ